MWACNYGTPLGVCVYGSAPQGRSGWSSIALQVEYVQRTGPCGHFQPFGHYSEWPAHSWKHRTSSRTQVCLVLGWLLLFSLSTLSHFRVFRPSKWDTQSTAFQAPQSSSWTEHLPLLAGTVSSFESSACPKLRGALLSSCEGPYLIVIPLQLIQKSTSQSLLLFRSSLIVQLKSRLFPSSLY